jgi:Zn-dependent protease with chaperone function
VGSLRTGADQRRLTHVAARRLIALAALGYVYLLSIVALVVVAIVATIVFVHPVVLALKIAAPLILLGLVVLRSLRVSVLPPEGVELQREQVPRLFELIDAIRNEVGAPRVDRVLIDDSISAAAALGPSLNPFGGSTYVVLGLPMVASQTPDELRAVVAHELAHFSRKHMRLGAWAMRARETWFQLQSNLEQHRSFGSFLFRRFFMWYVPYLDAQFGTTSRAGEFEADAVAADIAGGEALASLLVRLELGARFATTTYWPSVYARVNHEAQPPWGVTAGLCAALCDVGTLLDADLWVKEALSAESGRFDSHPSLVERLTALDLSEEGALDIPYPAPTAAQIYLGDHADEVARRYDTQWREDMRLRWTEEFTVAEHARAELAELAGRAEALKPDELRSYAALTARFHGDAAARPLYANLVAALPDDAQANFAFGRILVEAGDLEGVAYLDKAVALAPQSAIAAAEVALPLLERKDRVTDIAIFRERARQRRALVDKAQDERTAPLSDSELGPHRLSDVELARAQAALAEHPELMRVYVARRRFQYLADESPEYVVGVVRKNPGRGSDATLAAQRLLRAVASILDLPGETSVVLLDQAPRVFRKLKAIPEALVFDRGRRWHVSTGSRVRLAGLALLLLAAFGVPAISRATHERAQDITCSPGRGYAGLEYTDPTDTYDGVTATISAEAGPTGLTDDEHISGLVGVGDPERLYVAASIGAYGGMSGYAFQYETGRPRSHSFQQLRELGWVTNHQSRVIRLVRVSGNLWEVNIDNHRAAPLVELPGSEEGLPYPHTFLSSSNFDTPCNNGGAFRFSSIAVLPHGSTRWTTFPAATRKLAWPGYRFGAQGPDWFEASSIA